MADQFYDDVPSSSNSMSDDISQTEKTLGFIKDVFQNFVNSWSDTDASNITPANFKRTAVTAAGAYTMLATDVFIECDDSSGAQEVDLLAAATAGANRVVWIKKIGSTANVTIDGDGAETIDGSATKVLTTQYQCLGLICDGSNWHIFTYFDGSI
jgi:hypothetical protein